MSATDWVQALRGTPAKEAADLLNRLSTSADRATNADELEALVQHFRTVAELLHTVCINQLLAAAAEAVNEWPVAPRVSVIEIKVTQVPFYPGRPVKPSDKWVAYVDRPELEDAGAGEPADSPIAALRLFIAWALVKESDG